MTIDQ